MKAAGQAVVLIEEENWSVLDEGWIAQDLERYRASESAI
jgi:hypothetical protein